MKMLKALVDYLGPAKKMEQDGYLEHSIWSTCFYPAFLAFYRVESHIMDLISMRSSFQSTWGMFSCRGNIEQPSMFFYFYFHNKTKQNKPE